MKVSRLWSWSTYAHFSHHGYRLTEQLTKH